MKKNRAIELLNATAILADAISKIIDYSDLVGEPIINKIESDWCLENGQVNFNRYGDDMGDYFPLTISSMGMKGEKYFMGENDGLTYVMAYDEDSGWDETAIYVFDNKNKKEFVYE